MIVSYQPQEGKGGVVTGFHHQEMSLIQTGDGRGKSSDELFDGFRGDTVPR